MNSEKIKIGVVGCGRAGMIHARNFASRIREAEIVALVDPSEKNLGNAKSELGEIRTFRDYREAFSSVEMDAVLIASPTAYHREICCLSAESGTHVFCEKPMAMNATECEDMIKVCKREKVKLQIGFMRRFDRGFIAAKERIESGEIGEVVMVRSLTYGPSIPQPWMYDLAKSNGPLAEVSSHDIDTLRWFSGSEFSEVYAVGGNFRSPDAKKDFPDFYDNVTLAAKFANGAQGIVNGAQGVRYGYDARCEILGTVGVIFTGALEGNSVVTCNMKGMNRAIVSSWTELFLDAYLAEDRDFIDCILEDRPPKVAGIDGLMAVKVVNAGNESIRTGQTIKIN